MTARVAVVTDPDRCVGFAMTTTSFGLENGLIAELEDLYIAPAHRGSSLGELLVEDGKAWAHDRGCRQLEIVLAPNRRDISRLDSWYRRLGFRDEHRRLLITELHP
jgi:aminoglycoside 6'-N-acetyltransferase I